ncbi:MAG: capsular polysaccharide synthesis protein [Eubacterium sp.]|nr:capsular polysaccharide synthesis protein [Eubacterium sp.]
MRGELLQKLGYKISDRMLLGSLYDIFMRNVRYKAEPLRFNYNVLIGQKHRMLYYRMLKKKFFSEAVKERPWESIPKEANPKIIWFLWLQGMENAPLLVRRCYESLQQQFTDYRIIVLTKENLREYAQLPDFIEEKYSKGIISHAHYSDLIRLEVLIRNGGTWMDSTVLCTDGRLLRELESKPLFMYSFYYFGFNAEIMRANNWFIVSRSHDNILSLEQKLLYEYWKVYDRPVDYFLFMIFMSMVLEYYEEEAKEMPIVSQAEAHILATYIYDSFDESKYRILKNSTGFHKLSTRFEMDKAEQKGTFYDVVIRQGKL